MMEYIPLLLYLFSALIISFLCSILEAVLLSTPMSFITMKEQEGSAASHLLKKYKQENDKPLAAILAFNTIAHTIGAAGVGAEAQRVFENVPFAVISAILTLLILILSEIIPKTIGANYWRTLALPMTRIIHLLVILMYPLVIFSEFITRLVSRPSQQVSVSREEVSAMVTVGAEEGVLERTENRMIQNLLKLDDMTAREIMTPSSVVEMAKEDMTLRDFYSHKEYSTYSRIPIYNEENDDYIKGYVLRQTILEKLSEDKFDMHLTDIMRPILKFQETDSVGDIWETLLAKKEHISIIIDEYGCFRGIVTLEDVIETMLGTEIVDEKDTVTDMQELARSLWQEQQQEEQEQEQQLRQTSQEETQQDTKEEKK